MAYGVFVAENMASTKLASLLRTARYYNGSAEQDAIENGSIVKLTELETGEREVFKAEGVAAATDPIYLVDGVPLVYSEETTKGLDDFINEAGKTFRARKPQVGDIFSISDSMITALTNDTPVVGNVVVTPASGIKLEEKVSAGGTESFVGKVIEKYTLGTRAIPMTVIQVTKAD